MKCRKEKNDILRQIKMKHNKQKSLGHKEVTSKREIHSNKGLPKETRKISNKQYIFISKGTRKRINKV